MPKKPKSGKRFREFAIAIALVSTSLLLCLFLVEIGLRVFWNSDPSLHELYVADREMIYTLAADYDKEIPKLKESSPIPTFRISTSSQGLRDRYYGPKGADEYRILILGDSYTFGWGLSASETFSSALERCLADSETAKKVTVINAGVPGYAPWQERIFLRERGFPLEPDLVLFQAYIANDIEETLWRSGEHLEASIVQRRKVLLRTRLNEYWQVRLDGWLHRHSALLFEVRKKTGAPLPVVRFLNASRIFGQVPFPEFEPSAPRMWQHEPDLVQWYPALEQGWDSMLTDIQGIKTDCAERGVAFAAFGIPYPIDPGESRDYLESQPEGMYQLDKGMQELESFFAADGIPYAPILETFREHPSPQTLYFHSDGHLNPAGARVVAERLKSWLLLDAGLERTSSPAP